MAYWVCDLNVFYWFRGGVITGEETAILLKVGGKKNKPPASLLCDWLCTCMHFVYHIQELTMMKYMWPRQCLGLGKTRWIWSWTHRMVYLWHRTMYTQCVIMNCIKPAAMEVKWSIVMEVKNRYRCWISKTRAIARIEQIEYILIDHANNYTLYNDAKGMNFLLVTIPYLTRLRPDWYGIVNIRNLWPRPCSSYVACYYAMYLIWGLSIGQLPVSQLGPFPPKRG